MNAIGDTTMRGLEYALDGMKARMDVHANNLTNANTPGFRSARVDFESNLKQALASRDKDLDRTPGPQVKNAMGLADAQGNTVSLETEMTELMKANLMQRTLVNAYNFKVGVLRAAITGR
ncbi:MAG: flagellar basal body protein [Actinobacteria bacterium]|nr:flagellar basal body protein [Actinomycetota bacterium]